MLRLCSSMKKCRNSCIGEELIHKHKQIVIKMDYFRGGTVAENYRILFHNDYEAWKDGLKQIFQGLADAHEEGTVHCDIKGENILLKDDGKTPVICDWGLVQKVGSPIIKHSEGPPMFMAPEVWDKFQRRVNKRYS